MNLADLSAEFPRPDVDWRPQGKPYNGAILALAYIDARAVMDRLDAVCGPENWQDSYAETARGRVICTIKIKIGDEWVGKSDGAGDTQVEGEKGGISDAFKRAAVKWGIGRYLYDLDTPWVPCDVKKGTDGKDYFKAFSVDPWTKVRTKAAPAAQTQGNAAPDVSSLSVLVEHMDAARSLDELATIWSQHRGLQALPAAIKAKDRNKDRLAQVAA